MKHTLIALTVALATCTAAVAAPAKTAAAKKPVATRKAPVRKAVARNTTASKKPVQQKTTPTPKVVATPTSAATPAPVLVPGAAGEFPVYTGEFRCDGGSASITAEGDQFHLNVPGGRKYTMRRVPTSSGVVRLENDARAYWLQSGNKSMLIDERAGGRVADGCRNDIQQARENEIKLNPTSLLQ